MLIDEVFARRYSYFMSRGFTLIEIVVAVVFIGIVISGAVLLVTNSPHKPVPISSEMSEESMQSTQIPTGIPVTLTPRPTIEPTPTIIPTATPVYVAPTLSPVPTSVPTPISVPEPTDEPTPTPQPSCVSNTSPTFISHITDMSAVNYVVAPPTMGAGPSLKPHSYIGTNGVSVPLYAPAAMKVVSGSYYLGGPYMFEFQVSCEVTVRFGHMTNPIAILAALLPSEPNSENDSRTQYISGVSFNAGDLIGYTTGTSMAGNWDFGVYNSAISNQFASDPNWNTSSTYTAAVCPFEYFTSALKSEYVARFDAEILAGNPPYGEPFCQ